MYEVNQQYDLGVQNRILDRTFFSAVGSCLNIKKGKGLSKKEATQRLKEWFERFDILNWWDKKVEELSKGMAQKVQFIITVLPEIVSGQKTKYINLFVFFV